MDQEFTRQEMYDLVWSEPMVKLAKKWGVSDVALAKACRRAEIPLPGLGYWAKLQHGKHLERPVLPPGKPGSRDTVRIAPLPVRVERPLPPEVQAALEMESTPERKISVPNKLTNAHPIARTLLKSIEGRISKTERRRLCILSTLFKELERRGHALVPDPHNPRNVAVKIGAETVEFRLKEPQKQTRRADTAGERPHSFGGDWRHVLEPSGELVFTIQSWLDSGTRKQWSDRTGKLIEEQLNDIIVGLVLAGTSLHRRRIEREEEERRRSAAERERWELQEAKREKERQLQTLMQDVNAWQQAALIRQFVRAAKMASETGQRTFDQTRFELWASRALALANELDPLTSAEPLAENSSQTEAQPT